MLDHSEDIDLERVKNIDRVRRENSRSNREKRVIGGVAFSPDSENHQMEDKERARRLVILKRNYAEGKENIFEGVEN